MVLVGLQARSQNRIARDGPIGIKPRFAGQSMRRENQIKDSHNQNHSHAEPDAHANSRSIVASDSSAVHLVASPHRLNKKERLKSLFFFERLEIFRVAFGLHFFHLDKTHRGRVDGITFAGGRSRVLEKMAEVRVA